MHRAVTDMFSVLQKMLRDHCLQLPVVTWVLLLVTMGESHLPFLTAFLLEPCVGSERGGNPNADNSSGNMALRGVQSCISWDVDLTQASPAEGQRGR